MHARCMLDRGEHLARGHADPRPCVACRLEWPGENRPPQPAALARVLPMAGLGERWAAVKNELQFAALFQRRVLGPGAASYATTGVCSTFEHTVRAHGRNPLPRFSCALCFAMRWACLEGHTSFSPDQGNRKQLPATTVCCSRRRPSNHRTSCSEFLLQPNTPDPTPKNI